MSLYSPLCSSAPPAVITPKELTGDTIYILDGTSLLYKCFYGLGKQKFFSNLALKLTPSSGALEPQPCGAVAAMATSFTRFCKEVKPSHVVVVFDAGRVTFRNDLFPEYKQQRPEVRGCDSEMNVYYCYLILCVEASSHSLQCVVLYFRLLLR